MKTRARYPKHVAQRRLVLLEDDEKSEVAKVLVEYLPSLAVAQPVSGTAEREDIHALAKQHPGRTLAIEWLHPLLGWRRYLVLRRFDEDGLA